MVGEFKISNVMIVDNIMGWNEEQFFQQHILDICKKHKIHPNYTTWFAKKWNGDLATYEFKWCTEDEVPSLAAIAHYKRDGWQVREYPFTPKPKVRLIEEVLTNYNVAAAQTLAKKIMEVIDPKGEDKVYIPPFPKESEL